MFICNYCRDNCLEDKGIGVIRSKGACELCKYYDVCIDVHHYKCKKDWENLIYKE